MVAKAWLEDRSGSAAFGSPAIPRPNSFGRHDLSPLDKPPSLCVSPDDGIAVLATAIEPAPLQLQSGAIDLVDGLSAPLSLAPVGQEFSREPLQPCDHPAVFDVQNATPSTRIENFHDCRTGATGALTIPDARTRLWGRVSFVDEQQGYVLTANQVVARAYRERR